MIRVKLEAGRRDAASDSADEILSRAFRTPPRFPVRWESTVGKDGPWIQVAHQPTITVTLQFTSWLVKLCRKFFNFRHNYSVVNEFGQNKSTTNAQRLPSNSLGEGGGSRLSKWFSSLCRHRGFLAVFRNYYMRTLPESLVHVTFCGG